MAPIVRFESDSGLEETYGFHCCCERCVLEEACARSTEYTGGLMRVAE